MAYRQIGAIERRGVALRFAFPHFSLTELHPHALHAALAAEAADRQARFWDMHDLLFHRQKALRDEDLTGYAEALALDPATFAADDLLTAIEGAGARPDGAGDHRSTG